MEWTKITDGVPKEEGTYLCQFTDSSLEIVEMDQEAFDHLNGVEVYVYGSSVLDKITAWLPVAELPTPPPVPKRGGRPMITECNIL